MTPFIPLFKNTHWQTIAGHLWPRPSDRRFPGEKRRYRTDPDVEVLVEVLRPRGPSRGDMVLVHGLEGSGQAGYVRSLSVLGARSGYTMHRFNLRSCGGERLSKSVYHGGLTSDLLAVLRALESEGRTPLWLVGFSLGGNLVAKLAGELGEEARPLIARMCAASAAIDLQACSRRLGKPDNRMYEQRFVRMMRERACAVRGLTRTDFRGIRSLYELDDRITAPSWGFRDAEDYYTTQSANQFLARIRVPALFITAKDDTFIPFRIYDHPAFRENPCLRLVATEYGGHLGFIARSRMRFWLDHAILDWLTGHFQAP